MHTSWALVKENLNWKHRTVKPDMCGKEQGCDSEKPFQETCYSTSDHFGSCHQDEIVFSKEEQLVIHYNIVNSENIHTSNIYKQICLYLAIYMYVHMGISI